MKNFIYACNWKSFLTFEKAQQFITHNKETLKTLGNDYTLIICPSFDALATSKKELKNSTIQIGGQDCSAHHPGSYTGQVLAESLKQIGCQYCIIGHSETRKENQETTESISKKAGRLISNDIIPIICIGESAKEYDANLGAQIIEQQLTPILVAIQKEQSAQNKIIIAYEPVWSIGTGSIPSSQHIIKQIQIIKNCIAQHLPDYEFSILYGGSVDEININRFKGIDTLNGVLLGHASTDFQKLQKIVLS